MQKTTLFPKWVHQKQKSWYQPEQRPQFYTRGEVRTEQKQKQNVMPEVFRNHIRSYQSTENLQNRTKSLYNIIYAQNFIFALFFKVQKQNVKNKLMSTPVMTENNFFLNRIS